MPPTKRKPESQKGYLQRVVEAEESRLIHDALRAYNGNRTKAAKYLGISRRTLHYKLDLYGLNTFPTNTKKSA